MVEEAVAILEESLEETEQHVRKANTDVFNILMGGLLETEPEE
jgi:hypothetical protein